jgi:DNA-binding response OmpR family regulator
LALLILHVMMPGLNGLDVCRELRRDSDPMVLMLTARSSKEDMLAARPDRVFTRAQLLARTRGIERHSAERTIDVHVMNLRRKSEADPRRPACW